jgi:cytochrome c oxidase subunit IV
MARYRHLLMLWAALLVGTAATIGGAFLPGGRGDLALNLLIAAAMAAAVVIFFMKLRSSSGLARVFAGAGFYWLVIFLTLLAADYLTRALDAT